MGNQASGLSADCFGDFLHCITVDLYTFTTNGHLIMAGRKPTPTALKVIRGNPGKRPLNKDEPQPQVAVNIRPPTWLTKEAKKHWKVVSKQLSDVGILTDLDKHALTMYCEEYARWRDALQKMKDQEVIETDKGNEIQSPWVGIANKAFDHMLKIMSEFGMTPSSRSRLTVQPKEDFDPMEEFLKRNNA